MSFSFDRLLANTIDYSSPLFTAYPWTVDVVYIPTTTTASCCLWSEGDTGGIVNYWQLYVDGTVGDTSVLNFACNDGGGFTNAATTNLVHPGSRYHCTIVAASATDRRVILNGDWANSGTDATSVTPAGLDNTVVGGIRLLAVNTNYANGVIESVSAWSAALAQGEVEALGIGDASPWSIRRASLAYFLPMVNENPYVPDLRSSLGVPVTTDPATYVGATGHSRQGIAR